MMPNVIYDVMQACSHDSGRSFKTIDFIFGAEVAKGLLQVISFKCEHHRLSRSKVMTLSVTSCNDDASKSSNSETMLFDVMMTS
jgi:hypothetical protein